MIRHVSMMRGGAVEKEKTSHGRGPGFDSRPGNFFPLLGADLFCFVSFFQPFFYLLTGFNLFIVMLLYSFTRCCVKPFSTFSFKP